MCRRRFTPGQVNVKYAGQRQAGAKVHWRIGWRGRLSDTADAEIQFRKTLARISKEKGYRYG